MPPFTDSLEDLMQAFLSAEEEEPLLWLLTKEKRIVEEYSLARGALKKFIHQLRKDPENKELHSQAKWQADWLEKKQEELADIRKQIANCLK